MAGARRERPESVLRYVLGALYAGPIPPDFSRVRLRAGFLAGLAAAALRAEAFVLGRNVLLSKGAARSIASGSETGARLLAHELAHVEQYRRHGIFRFLRRYLSDYLGGRARGLPHGEAYASIAFEREAQERAAALRPALRPEGSPGGLPRGG
ncbi:MAG: eCIS core domain-containing protein [Thermoanaerobaculia bacterium]